MRKYRDKIVSCFDDGLVIFSLLHLMQYCKI